MLLNEEDMPRTKDGIIPDMIVNTHAFPSRMTIAQFLEVLLGKLCINKGLVSEVVPFSDIDVEGVANLLESCNFEKYGNELSNDYGRDKCFMSSKGGGRLSSGWL